MSNQKYIDFPKSKILNVPLLNILQRFNKPNNLFYFY